MGHGKEENLMRILIAICCSIFLFVNTAWAVNLDQAAADACGCTKEPYAEMERLKGVLQQAMASGDYSQMMKLEGDFAGLQDRAMKCYDKLRAKYPEIDGSQELQDQVAVRMDKLCPAPQFGFGPPVQ